MKSIYVAAVLFGAAMISFGQDKAPNDQPSETKAEAKLTKIIIPKIEWHDELVPDAIDFLRVKAVEYDPEHVGLPIKARFEPSGRGSRAGAPKALAPTPIREVKITLSLSDVPLDEALRYVADLAGMKMWKHPDLVELVPQSEPEPLVTKTFAIHPSLLAGLTADQKKELFKSFRQMSSKASLQARGVSFPPGASATFDRKRKILTVRNTADVMELVAMLVDELEPPPPELDADTRQPAPPMLVPEIEDMIFWPSPYSLIFVPQPDKRRLITKEYTLPPLVSFSSVALPRQGGNDRTEAINDVGPASSVYFEPGSYAIYVASKHLMIVRNTKEAHQLAQKLVEDAWAKEMERRAKKAAKAAK